MKWADEFSTLHGAIPSISFWSRVRSSIFSITTFPSEREIRRYDMPLCGGIDAGWDMAAIIFRSLGSLLRVVGVVRDAIWRLGIEVVDNYRVVDDLVGCNHLCEIVDGELD